MAKVSSIAILALLSVVLLHTCEAHNGIEHQVNGTAAFETYVTTLQNAGNFTVLLGLLNDSYYQEALNITSGKDRTIFAPLDSAFAELPANVTNNKTFVAEVLKFHIIPRYRNSTLLRNIAVLALPEVQTQYGANLTISVSGNDILVQNVTIITVDLLADDNTAIHTIGKVLIPSEPPSNVTEPSHSSSYPPPSGSGAAPHIAWRMSAVILSVAAAVALL